MNEAAAKSAVYTVIDDARATLVGGLIQNEVIRQLEWLTKTLLDVPSAYYAVGIRCERAIEHSHPKAFTTTDPNVAVAWVEYSMLLRAAEHAVPDTNGLFAEAHENFEKFSDRIVRLIRQTTKWFPSSASNPRFRLKIEPDVAQTVRKENDTLQPVQDGTYMLACSIRFALIDHCSDSSLLYP